MSFLRNVSRSERSDASTCSPIEILLLTILQGETEKHIDLPEDEPEMIRRLIAYCYLGNYDPCSSVALSSFSNLREHTSATPIAQALHSRLWREVPDPCACLMPLTQNSEQSVKSSIPSTSPLSSSSTDKAACSVQVANPLTIHAKM